MTRALAFLMLAACVQAASAQLRTIPKEALLGDLRHLQAMVVEIDGKARSLSPGAQIRDPDNRLVIPASLMQKTKVRYLVDHQGQVHRVWILSAAETAKLPPPPFPK
jgi:hypothetical protein